MEQGEEEEDFQGENCDNRSGMESRTRSRHERGVAIRSTTANTFFVQLSFSAFFFVSFSFEAARPANLIISF